MPDQGGEKSQDATPHRRQQAREEGQVAKSQDLGSAVILVLGLCALLATGGGLVDYFVDLATEYLGGVRLTADPEAFVGRWNQILSGLARHVLPVFGTLFVGAVLIDLFQVGVLFLPDKAMPDLSRLDPLAGLRRLLSLTNLVRLIFGLFKIALVAGVAYTALCGEWERILGLSSLELPQIARYLAELLVWTALKIGVALLVLALLDYGYQWWKQEQDLKMSQQEVREEMRNLEGDPQVIARRRNVQRQLVLNRLNTAVPKADVVVTNPTELAVAIQYEPAAMAAPIVVAKGAGLMAKRIRELALEHEIPIVEKKPLAQALFRDVELNHPIPHDKYAAVAEILAYVYQLKGKRIPGARA